MKSRREFIKGAATGALLLGSSAAADKLGLAALLDQHAETASPRLWWPGTRRCTAQVGAR